jgi:nucleotide-binding universal stress UspA family protein
MRSILLHIADDDCLEARTQVALDIARTFGSHLTCLQAVPYRDSVPAGIYGAYLSDLVPVIREAADALRQKCEQRLAPEDVAWSWMDQDGPPADQLLRASSVNDLVVIGSCEPFQTGPSSLAGQLAIKARTPVLVVPEQARGLDCSAPAVVAWNGSPEAAHAMKAAIPLLAKASSVILATVGGEMADPTELSPEEGAEYVSRHGISCTITDFPNRGGSVAQILCEAALVREASYLVMGAYGLPRFVETMFGGVTREILASPPLPIFTCH